jgi:WD40 repeat protein
LHDFDDEYGAGTAGYAFTHDSRKLISTSGKGPLQVWDTASGRRLAMSEAFFTTGSINQIALSPDGDRIATSEFPGRIRLWDAAELTEIRQMPADAGNIRSLIFSSDGTRIVAGYSPSTDRMFANPAATPGPDERAILAEMWDVESGKIARRFELPLAGEQVRDVRFMAFGEKDERLIVVDVSGTVRVWEVETGILRFKFETIPGRGQVNAYALSPDQKQLALLAAAFKNIRVGRTSGSASRGDDAITFWDLETGEQVRRIEVGESLGVHLKIHPSGRSAFTGTFPMGQFRVVDLDSGAIVRRIAPPFQINWADPAFAPDGKSFAISAENGTIVIYALEW